MKSCLEYVEIRKEELKNEVSEMIKKPKLMVVQIGNDKASSSYINSKKKLCEEIGLDFKHLSISDLQYSG